MEDTAAPLQGIRVVEFAQVASGPMVGMLLAEMGARVDKVEPPGGDRWRTAPPIHEGMSARFYSLNRGKRSITLDLKDPDDAAVARRLVARSDVVVENWRPGVALRLGFDWKDRSAHQGLIALSITGFGHSGPRAGDRAYDPVLQAVSGMAHSQGGPDQPTLTSSVLTDKLAALVGTQAVLGALVARKATGRGRFIPLSMMDVAISFSWPDLFGAFTFVQDTPVPDDEARPPRTSAVVRAGDGRFVAFNSLTEDDWRGLCEVADRLDLFDRYRELSVRAYATDEILPALEEGFARFDRDALLESLRRHDVPAGPVNSYEEVLADPQVVHNEVVRETVRAGLGAVRETAALAGKAVSAGWLGPAPRLGEHIDEIEAELGRAEADVGADANDGSDSEVGLLAGLCTTRAIRRFRADDIPEEDLGRILFAATRAPSGANRQLNRYIVLRRNDAAMPARRILAEAFREHWSRKRVGDRYDEGSGAELDSPKARQARVVQEFVDGFEDVPVVVLVCASGIRDGFGGFIDGASVFPACQNLLLAARGLGYGGVLSVWHLAAIERLRGELEIPADVTIAATIVLGVPRGKHGPVRRLPLSTVVYEGRWEDPAPWAVDPPGTSFSRAGPPSTSLQRKSS